MAIPSRPVAGPEVSVVIPVFNSGRLMLETIDSVIGQQEKSGMAVPDFEVLVVNDASDDPETQAILNALEQRDPRIRVLQNKRRKGAPGARNTAIDAARGAWIAFIDADDIWAPTVLAEWWKLAQRPDVKWIASNFVSLYEDGTTDQRSLPERAPWLNNLLSSRGFQDDVVRIERPVRELLQICWVLTSAVMIRRDVLNRAGGFDESMWRSQDYDLWLRCAILSDLHFLSIDAVLYRIRPGSLSRTGPEFTLEDYMLQKLRKDPRYASFRREIDQRIALVLNHYCNHYRLRKQRAKAIQCALRFIAKQPFFLQSWRQLVAGLVGKQ